MDQNANKICDSCGEVHDQVDRQRSEMGLDIVEVITKHIRVYGQDPVVLMETVMLSAIGAALTYKKATAFIELHRLIDEFMKNGAGKQMIDEMTAVTKLKQLSVTPDTVVN